MRGAYFAGAATETPRAPVFSMARVTSPDALGSESYSRPSSNTRSSTINHNNLVAPTGFEPVFQSRPRFRQFDLLVTTQ
jgi:hypothetical protein